MAIPLSDSGTRELVPPGLQLAICTEMVELGTSDDTFQGVAKPGRKVWLFFESCSEQREGNDGAYCLSVGRTFTASLGDKSALRPFLESWRGKPFTSDELKYFDLKNVLGKPCMINVIHSPKSSGSGDRAEISSISPIMKGMAVPQQTNPTRLLKLKISTGARLIVCPNS